MSPRHPRNVHIRNLTQKDVGVAIVELKWGCAGHRVRYQNEKCSTKNTIATEIELSSPEYKLVADIL